MIKSERNFLYDWKLKLGILSAIIFPTVTAAGAFFGLKSDIVERESEVNTRISLIELNNQKNFADKDTIREIRNDIKDMRSEMSEIKTLIIRKSR